MENRTMGGVDIDSYREYMKSDLDGLLLRNDSPSIDDIVADISDDEDFCSSVDPLEYKEFVNA